MRRLDLQTGPIPKALQSEWDLTGNVAVDMVSACVSFHRKRNNAIRTVVLHKKYFDLFRLWVEKTAAKHGRKLTGEEKLEFDSVEVKQGTKIMTDRLYVEFYTNA